MGAGGQKGVGGSTDGRGRGLTLGLGLEVGEGGAAEGKGGLRRDVPGIQTMQRVAACLCSTIELSQAYAACVCVASQWMRKSGWIGGALVCGMASSLG